MSASKNTEAMAGKAGEQFNNRVPGSEPLTTKGHKPGVLVGNEAVPEFHAETYPPGTAPREATFTSNVDESGATSAAAGAPSAADTLGGSTSADVHAGYGKPMQGQTSQEIHGTEKKNRSGLEGVGASAGVDSVRQKGADLPEGVHHGVRGGKTSADYPAAEEQEPVGAESLAAERKVPNRAYDYTQSK